MSKDAKAKPFLEWIHCNRCYEIYVNKRRVFYLLAGCYHVACAQCARQVEQSDQNGPLSYRCPLCLKVVRGCPLGNSMPKHLKDLFHPEPYRDGINIRQIMQFQAKHRQRFLDYINRTRRSHLEIKQNIEKFREMARKTYQELQQAKTDRKQIEARVLLVRKRQREMEEEQKAYHEQQAERATETAGIATKSPANTNVTSTPIQGQQNNLTDTGQSHLNTQRLLHLSSRSHLHSRSGLQAHSRSSSSSTRNTVISFMQPKSASFTL